jgi:PIN domain nuclease of toxin-antitoxin system
MELPPIRYEHILQLENLPLHQGEPFDRLLIAQAIAKSLPVLTHDAKFPLYPIKVVR